MTKDIDKLKSVAKALQNSIDQLLNTAGLTQTDDSDIQLRDIIEYESRMVVQGLEKFNDACFGTYSNIYKSQTDLDNRDPIGNLVVYVQEENAGKLLKGLGFPVKAEDDDEIIIEQLKPFHETVWNSFKSSLSNFGVGGAVTSEAQFFQNSVPDGIPFKYDEYNLCEVNFYLWKEKLLTLDLSIFLE